LSAFESLALLAALVGGVTAAEVELSPAGLLAAAGAFPESPVFALGALASGFFAGVGTFRVVTVGGDAGAAAGGAGTSAGG